MYTCDTSSINFNPKVFHRPSPSLFHAHNVYVNYIPPISTDCVEYNLIQN